MNSRRSARLVILVSLAFAAAMLIAAALPISPEASQTIVWSLLALWWVAFAFTLQGRGGRSAASEISCLARGIVRRLHRS